MSEDLFQMLEDSEESKEPWFATVLIAIDALGRPCVLTFETDLHPDLVKFNPFDDDIQEGGSTCLDDLSSDASAFQDVDPGSIWRCRFQHEFHHYSGFDGDDWEVDWKLLSKERVL